MAGVGAIRLASRRGGLRWNAAFLAFVLSPLVVPRMILAVGIFYFFAKIGLVGASLGLVLGHTVVAVPYVVITMMAVPRNYDTRLDLAAQSLGARPFTTLRGITFPILSAGMLSSFLFAFATSFDELTIALFTSGGLSTTLPKSCTSPQGSELTHRTGSQYRFAFDARDRKQQSPCDRSCLDGLVVRGNEEAERLAERESQRLSSSDRLPDNRSVANKKRGARDDQSVERHLRQSVFKFSLDSAIEDL